MEPLAQLGLDAGDPSSNNPWPLVPCHTNCLHPQGRNSQDQPGLESPLGCLKVLKLQCWLGRVQHDLPKASSLLKRELY